MKDTAKYISAASYDEAAALAAQHFSVAQDLLRIDVVREGSDSAPWTVLARKHSGNARALDHLNSFFQLYYEEDGVYLEVYPLRGNGEAINRDAVISYMTRKGFQSLDINAVMSVLDAGEGRAKVAPPQPEVLLGEDVSVAVSSDAMEASIRFLPPDEGGAAITPALVRQRLEEAGVTYGVQDDKIAAAIAEKLPDEPYAVAAGSLPVAGVDGTIEFHFRRELSKAPKELEAGRVDLRTLDLFEPVSEGQLLVTRHLATAGTSGYTVTGRELKARPGKEARMPKGKNVRMDEDKTIMHSLFNGRVDFAAGTVTVSNIYSVSGDVDMGVGNIDFDGSVVISGNIISGMLIKASGSITIGGVVEGSEIVAGGNIELKRGMQGVDRGKLIAGGSVTAQFIERATVIAGDSITADVIIHSNLEAGGSLHLSGKRGSVMGGLVRVTEEVTAKTVGSVSGTQTEIEVGLVPQKRARIAFLEEDIQRLRDELEKLEKLSGYLSRPQANMPDENRLKLLESSKESTLQNTQLLQEYSEELDRLQYEAVHAINGKVHVSGTTYPGVRISIASAAMRIDEPIQYSTFKFQKGEISFVACEKS